MATIAQIIEEVRADYPPHHDDLVHLDAGQYKEVTGNLAGYRLSVASLLEVRSIAKATDFVEVSTAERDALRYYVSIAEKVVA